MLPKGWSRLKLGELISGVHAGVSVNGEDRPATTNEVGVLKVSCVSTGTFVPIQNKAIQADEIALARTSPKADRVIVSRSNTEALVGASAYIPQNYPDLFLSDKLWQLEPREDGRVFMRWLAYWLASEPVRKVLASLGTGTSGSMKNISKDELLSLWVHVPDYPEQQAIAMAIEAWDSSINGIEKLLANSRRQKDALSLVFDWGGRRVNGRSGKVIRQHASDLFSPVSIRRNENAELLSVTQEQGVIPRRLLDRKVVMPEGATDSYKLVEPGDFVISLRSFEGGLEYSKYRGLVSPAYTVLRAKQPICDDFYRHYFKSKDFINRLSVAVIGIRDGKQISYDDFAFLKLPAPSIEVQQKVAAVLNDAEHEIELLTNHLEMLKAEKRALMADLLTGKRRVRMPDSMAEPEAA